MAAILRASIVMIVIMAGQGSMPAATTVIRVSLGDPRRPFVGTVVSGASLTVPPAALPTHRAWFFELSDGSTCRPLAEPGRIVEGELELYACKYGSAGQADAVLGDLDSSEAVWTIRKVLINKKAEPQTIKSLAIASVRTVWQ